VSGLLIGSYSFTPEDVVGVEPYGSMPLFGRGARIVHTRTDYPAKIVFWTFRNPDRVVEDIRHVGFLGRASSATVPVRTAMAFRWSAVISFVVAWNVLFLLDGSVAWKQPKPPGGFVLLALALVFTAAAAAQRSRAVQSWILKPGRSITEVRPILALLQLVSAFLFIGVALFRLGTR
jgi:hypothetical protein